MGSQLHPAEQYVKDIMSGDITACRFIRWAVQRHVDDLERSKDEDYPYYFDKETAQWYIDLFDFFILYEGEAAGGAFYLDDLAWIQFQLWCIFGWLRKSNGKRRFRKAFIMVAKKNIKTTFAGCLGLIMMMFDGEAGAQVYSAASNAKQAKICFRAAREIAKKSPAIRKKLDILSHNISHMESASFFEYISSQSAQTKDGLNPHCSIIDEYHAHPNNEVHDVLDSATAAREQPLVYIISTAGINVDGPCKEYQDYCEKILNPEDPTSDDSIFALIYTLDDRDEYKQEESWIKANPSLGVSVKYDDLRAKKRTADQLPSQLNNFLTKHMNWWCSSSEGFVLEDKWNACGTREMDPVMNNWRDILEEYKGVPCWGGLDLGSVSDFTSFVLVSENGDVIPFFWIAQDTIQDRKNKELVQGFVDSGYVYATDGDWTDHDFVEATIIEISRIVDLVNLPYDPRGMQQIATHLQNEGIEIEPFYQGFNDMSPAIDYLENAILQRKIEHFNNPVLSWMCGNIVIKKNQTENRMFDKKKAQDKIDGMVALTMALYQSENTDPDMDYYPDDLISV